MSEPPEETPREDVAGAGGPTRIAGDRGILSVLRGGSLQTRITNLLALGLVAVWAAGMIGWYYMHHFRTQSQTKQATRPPPRSQAQGDAPLPSLGRITPPGVSPVPDTDAVPDTNPLLGPPPELPPSETQSANFPERPSQQLVARPRGKSMLARRLAGPAFSNQPESQMASRAAVTSTAESGLPAAALSMGDTHAPRAAADPSSELSNLLKPSVTEVAHAGVLPSKRLLLPKGAFIDCTLETAIDSTLPGMTTCVTATDTFSVDGSTVLLERGTKLVGETRGDVQQGSARVFVLWTEARTPTGVVVPLASPGTDELGRSGLPGEVDRHFFQRFGAAMLISVIDGAVQAAVQSSRGTGTVIYNPTSSEQVMTEVLKGTVNIPPTIIKRNGDRIQILVARDVDFRGVYELRVTNP
jgi:type IV secretion system protein VirB10